MTIITHMIKSPVMRSVLSAIAGFVIYGLWAYWVNSGEGRTRALISALTQGSYSFIITVALNFFMEWFYRYLAGPHSVPKRFLGSPEKAWVIPVVVIIATCLLLYVTSWSIHVVANTPMIFFTILPGAIISSIYTIVYVLGIHFSSSKSE